MNIRNKKIVYLDYAATTPLSPEVKREMDLALDIYGNPSSLHSKGYEAKMALDGAREKIAKILNCRADEIFFTSGGTESDNLAVLGYARANKARGNHIITTAIEHHAVLEPCHKLEKEGFEITYLPVSKDGIVDLDEFKKALRPETILVSIMYANNEIGTIQPVTEITNIVRNFRNSKHEARNSKQIQNSKSQIQNQKVSDFGFRISDLQSAMPIVHTDACQAAGFSDLDVKKLGVDMLTLNAGKIYGPKGVGILYVRKGLPAGRQGLKLEPLVYGGGQEFGMRAGTENLAGVIGLAKALEFAQKNKEKESTRLLKLRDYLKEKIVAEIPKIKFNGSFNKDLRLPNNLNVSILDVEGESLVLYLDNAGICVSSGSACTSKSLEPSHVILAIGEPHEVAHSSLRFSLGHDTTKEDIDYVVKVLPEIVEKLRKISPLR